MLTVELVPRSSWYSNVRSNVDAEAWDRIRKKVYRAAKYRCEVCGGTGSRHPVECHEVWHYDEKTCVQKLTGMVALCPSCHEVKHIGLAGIKGRRNQAVDHLSKVNGWTRAQAEEHINQAFIQYERRSDMKWDLDITLLKYF